LRTRRFHGAFLSCWKWHWKKVVSPGEEPDEPEEGQPIVPQNLARTTQPRGTGATASQLKMRESQERETENGGPGDAKGSQAATERGRWGRVERI
jgi:hypothetical protein